MIQNEVIARALSNTGIEALNEMQQAVLDAGQDKLAAQLARGSMQNIGSLGMMAEQLANINPDVGGCCRAIMATYLKGSIKRLERW